MRNVLDRLSSKLDIAEEKFGSLEYGSVCVCVAERQT